MRVAGYVRVSTTEQVENGQGLEIQEAAIRQWCKANGHTVTAWYRDEGITGTKGEREGLEDALASVIYNGNQALVVASVTRLARDLMVQEWALRQIWDAGGKVFTAEAGEVPQDDPDDPMRKLTRQIMGAISEFEAATIRLRLKKGREHKKAAGGYAGGRPPYGWKAEGRELVPDAVEQDVLDAMRGLRADGASYRSIAQWLNDQGLSAKDGGSWHPQSVSRALENVSRAALA
jgi:DNA invertase Pin-like site-specific DNA recombinase